MRYLCYGKWLYVGRSARSALLVASSSRSAAIYVVGLARTRIRTALDERHLLILPLFHGDSTQKSVRFNSEQDFLIAVARADMECTTLGAQGHARLI
jgi:hypothetical protein